MIATAFIPALPATLLISVSIAIHFSQLAGQVGTPSLLDTAIGLLMIRQGASLVTAILLATGGWAPPPAPIWDRGPSLKKPMRWR